jgi:hypothetical protein
MADDASLPITLCLLDSEIQAAILVAELQADGIPATHSGGLTGGFRAEAPGRVKVLVPADRKQEAEAIFHRWADGSEDIDWDQVDVGEREDGTSP